MFSEEGERETLNSTNQPNPEEWRPSNTGPFEGICFSSV